MTDTSLHVIQININIAVGARHSVIIITSLLHEKELKRRNIQLQAWPSTKFYEYTDVHVYYTWTCRKLKWNIASQPRTQGTFRNESTLVDRGHMVSRYCPDFGQ